MERLKLVKYNMIDLCERFATFTYMDTETQFIACFREGIWDWDNPTIKEGTIIEASIVLQYILDFQYRDSNEKLITVQSIEDSPHVEAIVKITRCTEDKFGYWAKCNLFKSDILLNFERAVDCKVGDVIKIQGELAIENEKLGIFI